MIVDFDLRSNFVQIINDKSSLTEFTRHGFNPATLEVLPEVPIATPEDLDKATAAGKAAFKLWFATPYEDRKKAVLAYADAIGQYSDQFRDLLITEQGMPIFQASLETNNAINWICVMASLPLIEDVIEDDETRTVITRHVPLGVVGAIVLWNFPLMLATVKITPALLTSNVIIVKPSPSTPYGGLKLVELAQNFFPPGVVQSLSGDDNLGPWLTSHPGIDKIRFTGSTATGKRFLQSASGTLKRVTLELGGNDPAIVFPDVDIEKIAFFAFLNSGQICLNLKQIYVHSSIFEKFRDALVRQVESYTVGDGYKAGISHGPLQNDMQYSRVKTFLDDVEKQCWKVATGGRIEPSSGYMVTPTIIDRPPDNSRIVVEEPFGPIVPLLSWDDEAKVIERANNTSMGLGASIWTADLDRAARVACQIQAGTIWTNDHFSLSPTAPFGGHKESGVGLEWGLNGLKGFYNTQIMFLKKSV
ncbi:Aldehyde/histidinol dehydrogenase [Aspergillus insuetus]